MSNPLPNLRGGSSSQLLYGATHTISCLTGVTVHNSGSEQRFVLAPPLHSFTLNMPTLDTTDRAAWKTFFESVTGRLQKNLQITVNGETFSNLTLLSDTLNILTQKPILFDIGSITLRQVLQYPWTVPTIGSYVYPVVVGTGSVQFPYSFSEEYYTTTNDSPFGPRFSTGWYAASLTGFPTRALFRCKIMYSTLSDADVTTLTTFFTGVQGRYHSFSFTDPISGTTYTNMRFDMDALTIRFNDFGISSAEVILREFNT